MISKPNKTVPLSMGDELTAYDQSIVVGPVALFFNRMVKQKDIESVITIYSMGVAARGRLIHDLHSTLMEAICNVQIVGYTESREEINGE